MYVTNIQSNNIQQFSIGTDGSLTPATLYAAGLSYPNFMTFDKNNNYLYVGNANYGGQGFIMEYSIGTGGALTSIGSATQGITTANDIVIHPSNRWLYVLDAYGNIAQYSVGNTGVLAYVGVVTVPNSGASAYIPEIIAIDPAGTHAFVSAQWASDSSPSGHVGEVLEYSIDPTSGVLTLVNTAAAGVYARSIVLDPSATHVYVANAASGSISEYTVDPTAGLQPLATITTGSGVNSGPAQLNLDPTGQYIYASLQGDNAVAEFSINADGTLNSLGTISTGANSVPGWVASGN
jgi:6-phosphogluconolactonase (cycloisomerase 2 family)